MNNGVFLLAVVCTALLLQQVVDGVVKTVVVQYGLVENFLYTAPGAAIFWFVFFASFKFFRWQQLVVLLGWFVAKPVKDSV